MAKFDLTDEQRVALFLAIRMTNPAIELHRSFTFHREIEEGCFQFWGAVGVNRSRDTWVRACRRAKAAGMLGRVTEKRVPGSSYLRFHFDADLEDILVAVGPGYRLIPHGAKKARSGESGARQ